MFICEPCGKQRHGACKGETWCDCQHRTDGFPQEKRRSEWRVTDVNGDFRFSSSNWTLVQESLARNPGAVAWHRSIVEQITPWRRIDLLDLPELPSCRHCTEPIVPSMRSITGWTHSDWTGVHCKGRMTNAEPEPEPAEMPVEEHAR